MTTAPDPIPLEGTREQCEALALFVQQARASLHTVLLPDADCYEAVLRQDQKAAYWLEHLKARGIDA